MTVKIPEITLRMERPRRILFDGQFCHLFTFKNGHSVYKSYDSVEGHGKMLMMVLDLKSGVVLQVQVKKQKKKKYWSINEKRSTL